MPDPTTTSAAGAATPVGLPDFGSPSAGGAAPSAIGLLSDVSLQVRIELGRTKMLVEDVLKLNPDSVVELDKAAGDPVDIYVNGRRIARGEVLVLNENFCVRVSEILEPLEG
jgi:flagellar motor switch protein FliN/FliY